MALYCAILIASMKTVALISRKGGSGKTTLAVALAVAHEQAGGVAVVVDLDPQGSARTWSELRHQEPPIVASARPQTLDRVLRVARSAGTTLAIVDTGPREGGGTREAARQSDFVLIPSRPAAYDLATVPDTLAAITPDDTPAAIVLTCCPPRGPLPMQAAEYIREIGATLAPVTVVQRVAHVYAGIVGRTAMETAPDTPAAREIRDLHLWTVQHA